MKTMTKIMFFEVVEVTFDEKRTPDTIENVIGRYKNFSRAEADARTHYDKNVPKDYKTIVSDDFYYNSMRIAEKNAGKLEQYIVEVREVGFDD